MRGAISAAGDGIAAADRAFDDLAFQYRSLAIAVARQASKGTARLQLSSYGIIVLGGQNRVTWTARGKCELRQYVDIHMLRTAPQIA